MLVLLQDSLFETTNQSMCKQDTTVLFSYSDKEIWEWKSSLCEHMNSSKLEYFGCQWSRSRVCWFEDPGAALSSLGPVNLTSPVNLPCCAVASIISCGTKWIRAVISSQCSEQGAMKHDALSEGQDNILHQVSIMFWESICRAPVCCCIQWANWDFNKSYSSCAQHMASFAHHII